MKLKFVFISFVILLSVFFGLFYYKNNNKVKIPNNRTVRTSSMKIYGSPLSFKTEPYRIINDSTGTFIVDEKKVYRLNDSSSTIKENTEYENHEGNIYYFFENNSSKIVFNYTDQKIEVTNNKEKKTFTFDDIRINNIARLNNKIYLVGSKINNSDDISFYTLDYKSGDKKELVSLKSFFKDELRECKECFSNSLQGNFFNINQEKIGYFFYDAGITVVIDSSHSISKIPSITKQPFKVFQSRSISIPGGDFESATVCKSENEVFYQFDACSNGEKIYILSNLGIKEIGHKRLIDVYDVASKKYEYSFPLENNSDAKPISISTSKKYFIVAYDNNAIKRFQDYEK